VPVASQPMRNARTHVQFSFVEISHETEWYDVIDAELQRLELVLDSAQKPPRYVQSTTQSRSTVHSLRPSIYGVQKYTAV